MTSSEPWPQDQLIVAVGALVSLASVRPHPITGLRSLHRRPSSTHHHHAELMTTRARSSIAGSCACAPRPIRDRRRCRSNLSQQDAKDLQPALYQPVIATGSAVTCTLPTHCGRPPLEARMTPLRVAPSLSLPKAPDPSCSILTWLTVRPVRIWR